MSNILEMRKIAFEVKSLINSINDNIEQEKYLIDTRKGYLGGFNATTKPWYSLLIDEGEGKVRLLESYKEKLTEIKDSLEKVEVKL